MKISIVGAGISGLATAQAILTRKPDADITIFNPDIITDKATRENGALASSGIPYVIVNGTPIVKDSQIVEGIYPGKPVRRPVTEA